MRDTSSGRADADARARQNRTVLLRVALKIAVLLLVGGAGQHATDVVQDLLILSAILSGILAFALPEPWSPGLMTRWDEAAFFAFASLGVRIFA